MFGGKNKPDKEEWLKEAQRAYEAVFGERDRMTTPSPDRRLLTFSEIEEEAVREGNRLARWMLERKISSEAAHGNCQGEECTCPWCGKLAKRKREDLKTREVWARPGPVSFERVEYHCRACRRSFFPSGPRFEPQD